MLKKHPNLVIGHKGLSGVDCASWGDDIPNIVDYDLCIIDQSSLTQETLSDLPIPYQRQIRNLLCRYIKSNGELIVIYDQTLGDKRQTNSDWCPVEYSVHEESGNSISTLTYDFENYVKQIKSWERFLFKALLPSDFAGMLKKEQSDKVSIITNALVTNREGRALSWNLKFGVFHEQSGRGYSTSTFYNHDPDVIFGQITFLPKLTHMSSGDSIRTFLKCAFNIEQTTEVPKWVLDLPLPGLNTIDAEIDLHTQSINKIKQQILDAEKRRELVINYAKLVTATGTELESAVADAFQDLGAKVVPAKYSQEEFIVYWRDTEYLFEVKGVSKSIALTHVRQLMHYMLQYQEDTGNLCKAVLFGNAWRELSPDLRDQTDTPIFPPNVIETANTHHLGLLSAREFFEAYCAYKRGDVSGEFILDSVLGVDGVIRITST
jgi:hypothetical protein